MAEKKLYEARVTFTAWVDATNTENADEQLNELIDQLGAVQTNVPWDEVTWKYTKK